MTTRAELVHRLTFMVIMLVYYALFMALVADAALADDPGGTA